MKKARVTYFTQSYGSGMIEGQISDWTGTDRKEQIVSFIPSDEMSDKISALKNLEKEYQYSNVYTVSYNFTVEILSEEEAVFAE